MRPLRSVLYMPGSNARALEKARTLPADGLIFDLEDAVAPSMKATARQQVAAALQEGGYGHRFIVVRVNGPDTDWHEQDVRAAAAAKPGAILLPKVETPDMLRAAAGDIAAAGGEGIAIWAMMETPRAVLRALDIAEVAADIPLAAFVMGTNDLARETGASLAKGRAAFVPWLMACVAAAKANGLEIIDGVFNDFRDAAGLRAECEQGRLMGMSGKTLIHPAQLAAANEIFAPSDAEVAWAEKLAAAFAAPENAGRGAIEVDGRMVELLHLQMAERTLALAKAIADMEGRA